MADDLAEILGDLRYAVDLLESRRWWIDDDNEVASDLIASALDRLPAENRHLAIRADHARALVSDIRDHFTSYQDHIAAALARTAHQTLIALLQQIVGRVELLIVEGAPEKNRPKQRRQKAPQLADEMNKARKAGIPVSRGVKRTDGTVVVEVSEPLTNGNNDTDEAENWLRKHNAYPS